MPGPRQPVNAISFPDEGAISARFELATIAELTAFPAHRLNDGAGCLVKGYYAAGDGGGGLFYWDANSSAAANGGTIIAPDAGAGRWKRLYSGPVNLRWFGAKGDGVTDDVDSIQAAFAALETGGRLEIPAGAYLFSETLVLNRSASLVGFGSVSRQLEDGANVNSAVRFIYSGDETALLIERIETGTLNGLFFDGIEFKPSVSGEGGDGIVMDPSGSAIIGVKFSNCKIRSFGGAQIKSVSPGDVWDVTFENCSIVNAPTSTTHAADFIDSGAGGHMLEFVGCYIQSRAAGFFGVVGGACIFRGGAVEAFAGHGVKIGSGACIFGTHFEGFLAAGIIGVDFTGDGCIIAPGSIQSFVTGVRIGGINATVLGNITSNTTDILITSGASRRGTIINAQALTISDLRASNDGVLEVTSFKNGTAQIPSDFIGVKSISQTTAAAKNLRGSVGISGLNTTTVLTFPTEEPNASYFLALTPVFSTSGAAAGSNSIIAIDKTAAGFTITVVAAPGSGKTVNFDWILIR